jgi:hypothetical protein
MQASASAGEKSRSMVQVMQTIVKQEGMGGLFKGVIPRVFLGTFGIVLIKDQGKMYYINTHPPSLSPCLPPFLSSHVYRHMANALHGYRSQADQECLGLGRSQKVGRRREFGTKRMRASVLLYSFSFFTRLTRLFLQSSSPWHQLLSF